MKIAVINPPSFDKSLYTKEGRCEARKGAQLTPPITLGIIVAMLRKHQFFVYYRDFMTSPATIQGMKEYFSKNFDLAIVNTTTPTFEFDKKTARIIKDVSPKTRLCAIGTLVTALPEEALADGTFDYAVRREPEQTVLELVKYLSKAQKSRGIFGSQKQSFCGNKSFLWKQSFCGNKTELKGLKEIKGLSFYWDGQIIHNEPRPFIENLDSLPFPARDIFDKKAFIEPKSNEPYTVIRNSRGCPYQCTFCTTGSYYGKKWRTRSVKNILDEIKEVVTVHGIKNIMFLSDTFTANKEKIRELCNGIIQNRQDIKWVCNSRVNTIDLETAKLMKEAGCWLISFGVESGSEKILEGIKKNIQKEDAIKAAEICKEARIKSYMYYILGFPNETKETMQETTDFALKVDSDYARFFFAVPFPGSELFEECKRAGKLRTGNWSSYNQADCNCFARNNLSYKEVKTAIRRANRRFYLRPKYIARKFREMRLKEFINLSRTAFEYIKNWM